MHITCTYICTIQLNVTAPKLRAYLVGRSLFLHSLFIIDEEQTDWMRICAELSACPTYVRSNHPGTRTLEAPGCEAVFPGCRYLISAAVCVPIRCGRCYYPRTYLGI